jgi:dTDP-4-dehydrorhamnose 3,5-epimerase
MIEITPGEIAGVRVLRSAVQHDSRGSFVKTIEEHIFSQHGIPTSFAEQYYSVSEKNVLRGLHFQTPPHDHYKLVTCVEGDVFDVIVDLRKGSNYGHHQCFELKGVKGDGVFVPSGCAHGFYVRSRLAVMLYNVSTVHSAPHDAGIRWNSVGVSWPSSDPILSDRDAALVPFSDFNSPFASGV